MSPRSTPPDRREVLKGILTSAATTVGLASCSDTTAPANFGAPTDREGSTNSTSASAIVPPDPTGSVPQHRSSQNLYLSGNFAPVADELESTDLRVIGEIPKALNGSYIRNGPNPFDVPNPERHAWFPGAGMVHGITLSDGKALSYRNRFVVTSPYAAAHGLRETPGPHASLFDGSNTNVVVFRGQILSVAEGSLPYEIDRDLRTIRRLDYAGPSERLSHGLSAHCKYDPTTRELHNISYRIAPEPFAVWQVIGADGQISRSVNIDIDVTRMWHTFSLTDTYVVIFDGPVVFSPDRLRDGWMFPFAWDPSRATRVGLIERAGSGSVRWFDAPGGYVNHDVGAHDTPDGVRVYMSWSSRLFDRDAAGPLEVPPRIERWDIDAAAGTVTSETIDERALEFPRTAHRSTLTDVRYAYAIGDGPGTTGGGVLEPGNGIIKLDLSNGDAQRAAMGAARATSEATFVADPERSTDEDGGWLMSYVYDAETDKSEFVIYDAQDLGRGPLARVQLPQRVPFGFHGDWFPT